MLSRGSWQVWDDIGGLVRLLGLVPLPKHLLLCVPRHINRRIPSISNVRTGLALQVDSINCQIHVFETRYYVVEKVIKVIVWSILQYVFYYEQISFLFELRQAVYCLEFSSLSVRLKQSSIPFIAYVLLASLKLNKVRQPIISKAYFHDFVDFRIGSDVLQPQQVVQKVFRSRVGIRGIFLRIIYIPNLCVISFVIF